jgi:hypothetical protein
MRKSNCLLLFFLTFWLISGAQTRILPAKYYDEDFSDSIGPQNRTYSAIDSLSDLPVKLVHCPNDSLFLLYRRLDNVLCIPLTQTSIYYVRTGQLSTVLIEGKQVIMVELAIDYHSALGGGAVENLWGMSEREIHLVDLNAGKVLFSCTPQYSWGENAVTERDSTGEAIKWEDKESTYEYRFRLLSGRILLDSLKGDAEADLKMGTYKFNGHNFVRKTALRKKNFSGWNPSCYEDKDFLILASTSDYASAMRVVKKAAKAMQLKIDLRDLGKSPQLGLTLPKDTCKAFGFDGPCYLPRGRWDDGIYLSIEYSNEYEEFADGYYIVVAGSGIKKDALLQSTLKGVKVYYPDAYIKTSKVYLCCMH